MKSERLLREFDRQLTCWQMAFDNYLQLQSVEKRELKYGDFPLALQFNPARAVSTGAKIDPKSIASRPCFLCEKNRPSEQYVLESFDLWDVLINPFPIFPHHFTIVHREHQHQDNISSETIAKFAIEHPGFVTFYNGSASGASCPDHLHFQATLTEELPFCRYIEQNPGSFIAMNNGVKAYIADSMPAPVLHLISRGYKEETELWLNNLLKHDRTGQPDKSLRNIVIWEDEAKQLHTVLFARNCHRPEAYTSEAEEKSTGRYMVSPGAVDMAGLIITPRRCDFESLSSFEMARILTEVSYDFTSSEALRNLLMQ